MSFLRKSVVWLLTILALLLLAITVAGFLPIANYYVDEASQLRLPYILALVPLLGLLMMSRSRVGSIIAAAALLLNATVYGALYLPAPAPRTGDASVKIIAANIYGGHNSNYDAFVDLVHREQPDVLAVTEMTRTWMDELKTRLPEYAFEFHDTLVGGAAIFSRVPIHFIKLNGYPRYGVSGIISVGDKNLLFIASHPPAPSNKRGWNLRNGEFQRLAQDVRAARSIPVIIAGDLNSTPWSHYFQGLLNTASLLDSEQGRGPQPSWSVLHGMPLVPIDHCLHTRDVVITERRLGAPIGSDHLPVIFTAATTIRQ